MSQLVVVASQQKLVPRTCSSTRHPVTFRKRNLITPAHPPAAATQRTTLLSTSRRVLRCRASDSSAVPAGTPDSSAQQNNNLISSGGILVGVAYACLLGYVFLLAPGQVPEYDAYFLKKLCHLVDGPALNVVWKTLFTMMMGCAAVFARVIMPTATSGQKVPYWPFMIPSFGLVMYAIIPYFIFWQPQKQIPPPKELPDIQKIAWTVVDLGLLVVALLLWSKALLAGPAAWSEYFHLFWTSRLTHATSVDFLICTFTLPFFMYRDATIRGWDKRDQLVPILGALPVVGPAIYCLLRPKNY